MFDRGFEIGDTLIDFIFLIDIIITFRTVFIDDIGQEVSNPRLIAKNYITGQFWFDLMATIPMDLILEKVTGDNLKIYQAFGLLKLGRVLRLNKIISFLNVEKDVKAGMNLLKLILGLSIYIHFFACIWWVMIKDS